MRITRAVRRLAEGWRSLVTEHPGLLFALGVALASRLVYLQWFKVFPPGDVFNFINIARGLLEGIYPDRERRLPFYPALILLGRLVADWEPAALGVALAASLVGLVAIYALGRTLGVSKLALTAFLLVFQTQYQLLTASGRAYADTTMFALIPLTLLALLRSRTWRGAVATGLLAGAAAQTRYEGLAMAAVLLPLWFAFPRGLKRRLPLIAAGVSLLSLVPYFLLAANNRHPPYGAGYVVEAEGRSGYGSGNAREFFESFLGIWQRQGLLGAWRIPLAIVEEIRADPFATPRILAARLREPGEPIAILALLGILPFLRRGRWHGLLFPAAATAAATVPPAWFNPYPRYDIVVIPLIILLAASGVSVLQRLLTRATAAGGRAGTSVRWFAGAGLAVVTLGFWLPAFAETVRNRQLKHNGRDYAYYQAIHAARQLPGEIGFDRGPDIVWLYFPHRAVNLNEVPAQGETAAEAVARMRAAGVRYLVLPKPGEKPAQAELIARPELLLVQSFEWLQGNRDTSRAAIYEVR